MGKGAGKMNKRAAQVNRDCNPDAPTATAEQRKRRFGGAHQQAPLYATLVASTTKLGIHHDPLISRDLHLHHSPVLTLILTLVIISEVYRPLQLITLLKLAGPLM